MIEIVYPFGRSMTRKYIGLFLFTCILFFSLLEGAFGQKGILVNRSLQRTVSKRQAILDREKVELEILQNRLATVWEKDQLLDTARRIGYSLPNETVYFFLDTEAAEEPVESHEVEKTEKSVTGLPRRWTFLISLCCSALVTITAALMRRKQRAAR